MLNIIADGIGVLITLMSVSFIAHTLNFAKDSEEYLHNEMADLMQYMKGETFKEKYVDQYKTEWPYIVKSLLAWPFEFFAAHFIHPGYFPESLATKFNRAKVKLTEKHHASSH